MTRLAIIFLCSLPASLAAQNWVCNMSVECFDEEPCAKTDYEFSLGELEGGVAPFLLSDIAGERPMNVVPVMGESDQRAFVSMVQNTTVGLVSIFETGVAQYTMQSADFMVTYRGKCEDRE